MASTRRSLRDCQVAAIEKVLNLNQQASDGTGHGSYANGTSSLPATSTPILGPEGDPIWKVLVFDNLGRDVISSVLRVSDLRNWGITIHLNINQARHPIPDVPVLYFVEPTTANLQIITSDLMRRLYSPAYVNFLSSIPRPTLEEFASQTATAGTAESIAQVFDQYLNFIVSEPDLFSLGMGIGRYWTLNSPKAEDEEIDTLVDKVVSGLFSVVVTMGAIPIIRCPKGNAADMIATKLDRKLRDHVLNSKDNLFAPGSRSGLSQPMSSARPVLIILDRNIDISPMLLHGWTYQSLVHDVLKMHLNRITVQSPIDESNPSKGNRNQNYDLNAKDFFWSKNAGVPFPQVAEDIDAELTRYKEDAAEITRKTGTTSLEDLQNDTSADAARLKTAITQLPELRERKATLDMHMTIATALLQGIKDRQLDNYFQIEENITKQNKAQILELIKDPEKGQNAQDKVRLFIIWFLSTEQEVTRADMERFEEALKGCGGDIRPVTYIRKVRELTRMTMMTTAPAASAQPPSSNQNLLRGFSSLSSRLTDRIQTGALASNFETLISGVKNFLPQNKDLTITKLTESIMDPQNASSSAIAKTENYLYFDPRSANARGTMPEKSQRNQQQAAIPGGFGMDGLSRGANASFGQRRQTYNEAIVFTVGGGCMEEYGNLQEWAKRTSPGGPQAASSIGAGVRKIVYGSTEIINAEDFLTKELGRLGEE